MVNIRQDPFERTPSIGGQSLNDMGGGYMNDFYAREFWRFVTVQQKSPSWRTTAIDYPPMQDPASFNLDASSARSTRRSATSRETETRLHALDGEAGDPGLVVILKQFQKKAATVSWRFAAPPRLELR